MAGSVSIEAVREGVELLPFSLNELQIQKFAQYLSNMVLWNRAYNLTAITEPKEMVIKHLLDSLVLLPHLVDKVPSGRFIDVGSGAGLPGIPLSIALPEHHFTLLDSSGKRTRFMTQMKLELGLKNIEVIHSRVQDYQPEVRFDAVLSRAFASGKDMVEWSSHLLKPAGYMAAMKGKFDPEEWADVEGFSQREIVQLEVPKLNEERHLIFLSA